MTNGIKTFAKASDKSHMHGRTGNTSAIKMSQEHVELAKQALKDASEPEVAKLQPDFRAFAKAYYPLMAKQMGFNGVWDDLTGNTQDAYVDFLKAFHKEFLK